MNADFSKVQTINMAIFQPRLKTIPSSPEWSCSRTDLAIFAEDMKVKVQRVADAKKYSVPNETYSYQQKWVEEYLSPSENACQWCKVGNNPSSPKKGTCAALAKQCLALINPISDADDYGLEALDDSVSGSAPGLDLSDDIKYAIATVPELPFKTLAKIYGAKGLIADWMIGMCTYVAFCKTDS